MLANAFHRVAYTLVMTCIVSLGLAQVETNVSSTVENSSSPKVTDDKEIHFEITTSFGTMKGKLYNATPLHRDNFAKLVQENYYDSLLFHRVISQFMIQGGDPNSRNAKPNQQLGDGGPDYTIPAEFVDTLFHKKGALSAARQGDNVNPTKRSSGSQFYIVQGKTYTEPMLATQEARVNQQRVNQALNDYLRAPENKDDLNAVMYCQSRRLNDSLSKIVKRIQPLIADDIDSIAFTPKQKKLYSTIGGTPHLDGNYTVFGKIYEGLDIIDKIASVPRDRNDRPLADVRMSIRLIEAPSE